MNDDLPPIWLFIMVPSPLEAHETARSVPPGASACMDSGVGIDQHPPSKNRDTKAQGTAF
jgi:hypothetical protein